MLLDSNGNRENSQRPASSIGSWVPWATGSLGSCAAPLKKIELSPAQGKEGRGCRICRCGSMNFPVFLSLLVSAGNIQSPELLFCLPITSMHSLNVLDPFLHCVSSVTGSSLWKKLEKKAGGSPKAGKKKKKIKKQAGLECHWRASRFSKPWDLIPEPQLLPAVPSLLLTSGL